MEKRKIRAGQGGLGGGSVGIFNWLVRIGLTEKLISEPNLVRSEGVSHEDKQETLKSRQREQTVQRPQGSLHLLN